MKKILSFFKSYTFGIPSLLTGIILIALSIPILFNTPDYGSAVSPFTTVTGLCEGKDGMLYAADFGKTPSVLYRIDPTTNKADMAINSSSMPYENAMFYDVCTDDENNLYCNIVISGDDYCEVIAMLSPDGKFKREIVRSSFGGFYGTHINGDKLEYLLYDGEYNVKIISADTDDTEIEIIAEYNDEYNEFLSDAQYCSDGTYIIVRNNSDICSLDREGNLETLASPDFSLKDYYNSYNYNSAAKVGNDIYTAGGLVMSKLFRIIDGEAVTVIDTTSYVDDADANSYLEVCDKSMSLTRLFDLDGKLAASADRAIILKNETTGGFDIINSVELPTKTAFLFGLAKAMPAIGGTLSILGLISCIGCLMNWRFTILSKQLWLTIPMICVMICVYIFYMTSSIKNTYHDNIRNQLVAISESAIHMFDGDMMAGIDGYASVDDGTIEEISEKVNSVSGEYTEDWNSNLSAATYLCATDDIWVSPDGGDSSQPFNMVFFAGMLDENDIIYRNEMGLFVKNVYYTGGTEPVELAAFTPIRTSDGDIAGYLVLSANLNVIEKEILIMQFNAACVGIVFLILLIIVVVLTSMYIVKNLRKASSAVIDIANGDFSSRITNAPKDEIGEICSGVNNMAGQLQTMFDEKDRNEQFYYKFVPEKFRELLHKESFTDLALGDAESADLTVLFCDIRSFSLNSEMMTAKENFEFVNVIYGKAGPIIRRNGGFVDKYIGDAVMALFEDADSAVKAGIELYNEIVLKPDTAEMLGVSSINIGVGIHSGMARIGIVGEDERMSGTVISNTVNISSRLESLTKQYNTAMIISKDTLDRMSDPDSLNMRYLGMVQVAGVNEVKALYEVLDCLDEKRCTERTATKNDFREAVRLFHLGNLEGSAELFHKIEKENPNDPAVGKYIAYIEKKIENGDMEHNVFKIEKK